MSGFSREVDLYIVGSGGHDDFRHEPKGPNTPGGGDGMDLTPRVARLEEDMKEVRADLKMIRSDVSELKSKVSTLPGYGGIALIVGLIVGLSTLAQVAAQYLP